MELFIYETMIQNDKAIVKTANIKIRLMFVERNKVKIVTPNSYQMKV